MTRWVELVTGLDQLGAQRGMPGSECRVGRRAVCEVGAGGGPCREHAALGGLTAAGSCCGHKEEVKGPPAGTMGQGE